MSMKNVLTAILALATITVLIFISACDDSVTAEDGKITVSLTGASEADGQRLYAYFYASGETDLNSASALIATNSAAITGGTASFTLEQDDGDWMPDGTEWTGVGDTGGDIYIYTDADTDGDSDPATSSGIPAPKKAENFPLAVTIDGDQNLTLSYSDMLDYNDGPHQGKLHVVLTGAETAEGQYLFAYLYAENEVDINNAAAVLAVNSAQISGGTASFTLENDDGAWMPDGTEWIGSGGVSYDLYVYTDGDSDGDPETGAGDPGPKAASSFPTVVTIDKDYTASNTYGSMPDYPSPPAQ